MEVDEEIVKLSKTSGMNRASKAKRARVLGTRAPRDLPTDVEPSCLAKVKPMTG